MKANHFGPIAILGLGALVAGGCPGTTATQGETRNAFQSLAETFGSTRLADDDDDAGGVLDEAEDFFRQEMTLELLNFEWEADLETQLLAWITPSSIRSVEQEDILIANGYTQLGENLSIGTVLDLPAGTFVFNAVPIGSRVSTTPQGIHRIRLAAAAVVSDMDTGEAAESDAASAGRPRFFLGEEELEATGLDFTLITPDGVLLFYDPPISCESVAFRFTVNGRPVDPDETTGLTFGGATDSGFLTPFKTLMQIEGYTCEPFRPGFYFRRGGGLAGNEYFEGQDITISFSGHGFTGSEDFALVDIQ